MNLFADVEATIVAALTELVAEGSLPPGLNVTSIGVESTKDPSHGDIACNAAMVLAKSAGLKPRDIAAKLTAKLESDARFS